MTSRIVFSMVVAFIVFITVKGELPAYLGVVGIGSAGAAPAAKPPATAAK